MLLGSTPTLTFTVLHARWTLEPCMSDAIEVGAALLEEEEKNLNINSAL